ncbi:hypothetical protein [Rhodococcus sp. (in: high G+C Gram-positive bacteria)]|uniref:hypothetical protein n=1 Tax=unclassified Rhodococcus (in: high G+C Gram-positive bacteria) TaxID=192944 RepID=UPI00345C1FB5
MPDSNNPGQFGNREDTEEQARRGGEAGTGRFGDKNSADPSEAGQQGRAGATHRSQGPRRREQRKLVTEDAGRGGAA